MVHLNLPLCNPHLIFICPHYTNTCFPKHDQANVRAIHTKSANSTTMSIAFFTDHVRNSKEYLQQYHTRPRPTKIYRSIMCYTVKPTVFFIHIYVRISVLCIKKRIQLNSLTINCKNV